MSGEDRSATLTRRAILRASGGAVGVAGMGTARADPSDRKRLGTCPDATIEPSMEHCDASNVAACADDHPATQAIQAEVRDSLHRNYPTVGALIDDGFVPYFDLVTSHDRDGWSHWLSPEYLGDDSVLDPERPEAVLVDNEFWRPIGVMFVATRGGESVEPPSVYEDYSGQRCAPWHYHAGLPGRYAWWKYQQLSADSLGELSLRKPCRTPCVMHVWIYPNPDGVYAHDAPPRENRGGAPAEPAGFDTAATPGEDALGRAALPDDLGWDGSSLG